MSRVKRNLFTVIFDCVGTRKTVVRRRKTPCAKKRTKMQKIRRAHQGWRNKVFGSIMALQLRIKYGRRKPVPQFRR